MIRSNRTRRATIKTRANTNRATRKAHRAIATGNPQTARTHLTAAGLTDTTAKRYAPAFSRGIIADQITLTRIKLRGRTRKTVQAKLYTHATFTQRLATYRPKDKTAAQLFARAAHTLAA
jgi:hypothetical protein